MKTILIAVGVLFLVSPVLAQDPDHDVFLGPNDKGIKPLPSAMKQRIEEVVGKIKIDEFDAAYNSYVELLAVKGKISAKKHKQALLEMARAYMRLPVGFRLAHGNSYFSGSWKVDSADVDIRPFLEQQKKSLSSADQKEYADFLETIQEDIEDYRRVYNPPMGGIDRSIHPAAR